MSAIAELDLAPFLKGPDLLFRNGFRLAQLPVDASDRKLSKRQQMIEMARKRNMVVPEGPCPIFTPQNSNGEDHLKEALHLMRDPINRLFDELFWFWPMDFGDGEKDEGLSLLAEGKIDEVKKHWKRHEKKNKNFIANHNLALLHQFLALQIDDALISSKEPLRIEKGFLGFGGAKNGEKAARKHWKEASDKWSVVIKQDTFWELLKDRIRNLNDLRLPVETADWFRQHMPSILISINAGLVLQAAEYDLKSHIDRQKQILIDTGFDNEKFESVFEIFTRKHQQQIKHLCNTAKENAKRDPVNAHKPSRQLAEQAIPLLRLLGNVYSSNNRRIDTLHDEVAETIMECQITYGNKTEDWEGSEALLILAKPIAKSESVSSRIRENVQQVQKNHEAENIWCEKGYFNLPNACIELLEKARAHEDVGRYDGAIDLLRKALFGFIELPDHPDLRQHLRHCIAYCFKSKSVVAYNEAFEEQNQKVRKILVDSLKCDGYIGDGYGMCASCEGKIYGSYVNRTIEDHIFPFCTSCSSRVDRNMNKLDEALNKVIKESLILITLSHAFDLDWKPAIRNLNSIKEEAEKKCIYEVDPQDIRIKRNLLDPDETINLLVAGQGNLDKTLFDNLTKMISAQTDRAKKRTLSTLCSSISKSKDVFRRILPLLFQDDYIFAKFVKHVLAADISRNGIDSEVVSGVLIEIDDFQIKFSVINQLVAYFDRPPELVEALIKSLDKIVKNMVEKGWCISFKSEGLGELLSYASRYSKNLEKHLIKQTIVDVVASKEIEKIEMLIRAVHDNDRALHIFYRGVFFSERIFDSKIRTVIIDALLKTSDFSVQFLVLKGLKKRGEQSSTFVQKLKLSIVQVVITLVDEQIKLNPLNWNCGKIRTAFSSAASYGCEFENHLFVSLIKFSAKAEESAGNMIKAVSLIKKDEDRFLALLKGDALKVTGRERTLFYKLLASHWDENMRLIALQWFSENIKNPKIFVQRLITSLADNSDGNRAFAHDHLLSSPNECLPLVLEAVHTKDKRQLKALLMLLKALRSRIDLDSCRPPLEDIIRLITHLKDKQLLPLLRNYLEEWYPDWVQEKALKPCLPWLKQAKKYGTFTQSAIADELLEEVRGQSFGSRISLWLTKQSPATTGDDARWWQLSIMVRP